MRISDWSSDVCSSDLPPPFPSGGRASAAPLVYTSRRPIRHTPYPRAAARGGATGSRRPVTPLRWLITLPLAIVLVVFAVNNRQETALRSAERPVRTR